MTALQKSDHVPDIAEMDLAELEAALVARGSEAFHGRQIYRWLYRRGVSEFDAMTDLPRPMRTRLAAELRIATPAVIQRETSTDGTMKFLLGLEDGRQIEAVCIPDTPRVARARRDEPGMGTAASGESAPPAERMTFCISTQVGCAMRCGFCLTGKMGLVRNLTAGEIAGQVRVLAGETGLRDKRFNIVLMGMGEPLHNYDHTMKALRVLADPQGLAISPRRVTLSTVGVVPALERLAREPLLPNLAISLHATTEEQRDFLVPVNRKYGLQDILDACRRFPLKHRSRITFEYVLLGGVNDSPEDARRLVRLMRGIKSKINLIPLNEAPGIPFKRPTDHDVNAFARILASHGLTVSVRKSRGRDIRAACGQLIVEGTRKSAPQELAARMSAAVPSSDPRSP